MTDDPKTLQTVGVDSFDPESLRLAQVFTEGSVNGEFSQELDRPNGEAIEGPKLKVVDGTVADPFDDLESLKCDQGFAEKATPGNYSLASQCAGRVQPIGSW